MSFPSTAVLDNATRADEGPPPSANWTTIPFAYGPPGHVISSNLIAPDAGGAFSGDFAASYWSATTFPADQECRIGTNTLSVSAGNRVVLFLRLKDIASGTIDGYEVHFNATANEVKIFRSDNETTTQLGGTITQECNQGDVFGARIVGSDITAWRAAAGADIWELVGSRSDSTYTGSGYIGFYNDSVNDRFSYFAGGAYYPPFRRAVY